MISLVQHASGTGSFTSGTSGTVTVTISAAGAGNCLVACVNGVGSSAAPSVSAVKTGSSAENWAKGVEVDDASNTACSAVWADPNTGGGGTTVVVTVAFNATATSTNSVLALVDVFEFSGVASASPVDKTTASGAGGHSASWSSGTSGATTQAAEAWVGTMTATALSGTLTVSGPSSPWANETALSGTAALGGTTYNCYSLSGYQIASSTGTVTYNGTTSVSGIWDAAALSLKGATSNATVAGPVATSALAAPAGTVSAGLPSLPSLQLPGNLLAPADCDFESWTGNWTAGSNTTVAQSSAQAFTGSYSMALTATAAGSVTALSASLPAFAKAGYVLSCYVMTPAGSRTADVGANWLAAGGGYLSSSSGSVLAVAGSAAFQPVTAAVSSPASTGKVQAYVQVYGLGAGETVYVDLVYAAPSWAQFLAAWYTQPGSSSPVFADITPWVRADKGVSITRGRDDEVTESQAGKLTFTADNTAGWFTIGSTASPWYPNVLLGRRIQVNRPDETGAWHTRADMRLTDLPVSWEGGGARESLVACAASGVLANVGRMDELRTMLEQEVLLDSPSCFYVLADPSGSATASDSSGNGAAPLVQRTYGSGGALAFGSGGGIIEAGTLAGTSPVTSVLCTPKNTGSSASAQNDVQLEGFLPSPVTASSGFTFEVWSTGIDFAFNTGGATWWAIGLGNPRTGQMIGVRMAGGSGSQVPALQLAYTANQYAASPSYTTATLSNAFNGFPVNQPSQFAVTVSGTTATLWYNGSSVGSITVPSSLEATYLTVGGPLGGNQGWQGSLNAASVYPSVLSSGRLSDHSSAGQNAYADQYVNFMMARVAAYAGLPSWATSLAGAVVSRVDPWTLSGQTPLAALQAYEQADGGVLYENAAGQLAYQDRTARYAAQASSATILALAAGQYEPDYLPSATDQFLVNDCTVSTPLIAAGVRALNSASIADYGTYANGTPQSPVSGPYYSLPAPGVQALGSSRAADVLADAASYDVGVNCQPGPRSPKVTIDLLTAPGDGLSKAAVYAAEIGTCASLAGLPSQSPGGTRAAYLMIEGVAESFGIDEQGAYDTITFNTSPSMRSAAWLAGDSAMGVLDSTAVVGRGSDGNASGYVGQPYTVPTFSSTMNLTGNIGAGDLRGLWYNVQQQVTPPIALALQIANAQSVPNSTNTDLVWDTLLVDSAVGWTLQTGNAWYTVQVAGVYTLAACVQFASNATGDRAAWFQQNGAYVGPQEQIAATGSSVTTGLFTTTTITAAAGDQIKVSCWQSSGGALSTSLAGGGSTFSILFQGT